MALRVGNPRGPGWGKLVALSGESWWPHPGNARGPTPGENSWPGVGNTTGPLQWQHDKPEYSEVIGKEC